MKVRASNIELLRTLAMVGVVILHICNPDIGGGLASVAAPEANFFILSSLESVFIGAVDLYLIISGFFMGQSRREIMQLRKPVRLLIQVIVFRLAFYGLDILRGNDVLSITALCYTLLPVNYFVVLYCVVYFLSPYINKLLNSLDDSAYKRLLLILLLLFSLEPTLVNILESWRDCTLSGLSAVSISGDQGGYNIVNFILCYILGASFNRFQPRKKWLPAAGFLLCLILDILWKCFVNIAGHGNYSNPLVLGMAVCAFWMFRSWDLGTSRVINFLAKASFTVFLIHTKLFFLFDFSRICTFHPALMPLLVLLSAAAIYLLCVPVWFIYEHIYNFLESRFLLLWDQRQKVQD